MLLLPGSLPPDRATLKALCEGLAQLPDTASWLQRATVEAYSGSWSDAEREASGTSGDLNDAIALARQHHQAGDEAVSIAIATPLHAALGLTDLTPVDPSTLSLSTDDSRVLCEAADAHLREDGVRLHFIDAARWRVTCNKSVEVLTERPDWIVGELLRPHLPRGRDARTVERLMNELQMVLHTHPVNAARETRGLLPVNLVWLWGWSPFPAPDSAKHDGAGGVDNRPPSTDILTHTLTLTPSLSRPRSTGQAVEQGFAIAMRRGDLAGWQATWRSVSPEIMSSHTVLLGDSRPRLRLTVATPGIASRLLWRFKRKVTLGEALTELQESR